MSASAAQARSSSSITLATIVAPQSSVAVQGTTNANSEHTAKATLRCDGVLIWLRMVPPCGLSHRSPIGDATAPDRCRTQSPVNMKAALLKVLGDFLEFSGLVSGGALASWSLKSSAVLPSSRRPPAY